MNSSPPRLGMRENLAQFMLLVLVNAFVGAMVGMERSILPALAEHEFQLAARTAILSFIIVFGVTKAATNYVAGRLSDAWGRKVVLVAGWLVAAPVPFVLIWAPSWGWILGANVLLGVSQGLTWSTTVIMKIDLAGPKNRGLAMGINEFAGYVAVALAALGTGWLAARYGLRPEPFYIGIGFVAIGLLLSVLLVRETRHHVAAEATLRGELPSEGLPSQREIFWRASLLDKDLSSVSQAGLVNNLNDGMAWGLFPLAFAAAGMSLEQIGLLAAFYPAIWGIAQLFTGALSDRIGRKGLIVGGMWTQALGIVTIALGNDFGTFAGGAVLLGLGTAMVYPTLLAAIGDVAHPSWRASSVGVYRLWRDLGYAVGAFIAGVVADALGLDAAIFTIAAITFASGTLVAFRMRETLGRATALAKTRADHDGPCIAVAELRRRLDRRDDIALIDVRSPDEFAAGHIDGAINIPVDELEAKLDVLREASALVTVCAKGGGRSASAVTMLRAHGWSNSHWLCGGTLGWLAAESPDDNSARAS